MSKTILVATADCSTNASTPSTSTTTQSATSGKQTVTIEMNEFMYKPLNIEVQAGKSVHFVMKT